jgi:hypothetical protein
MVENQCQLRLISQSKAPKVRQSAKRGRPTKDAFRIQIVNCGLPSRSWLTEKRRSKYATIVRATKKKTARKRKNCQLR